MYYNAYIDTYFEVTKMRIVTATELKKNMSHILKQSWDSKEPVILKRPHGNDMAIIDLAEYESLKETAYLLSHNANVRHLMESLLELSQGKVINKTLDELKKLED